jgi:hypothetical protein
MRKRSNYKPKPIVSPVMRTSLQGKDADNLKFIGYHALDVIARGAGGYAQFDCVNMAVSVCTVLAEKGYGKEHLDVCRDAIDAIRRMGERAGKVGKYALDGDGLKAVRLCLDLHCQQVDMCTRLALSDAIYEAERRIKALGLPRSSYPDEVEKNS